ncbi:MAG TPA: class I SAM-dependent methyltransferase [Gemmatimonadales bacterium]|jgi:SAM-dependent methyltransferase|nr:class I SAM-dependent methyltransferase [Gemmatimonadales bacterium]
MTDWFKHWFGEEYHALYPHRDDEDARRAVALIRGAVHWSAGDRILDLACGPGRHAVELARSGEGVRIVGFDLSRAMLRRARERTGGGAALVRGDMRALPFRPGSFALAVNLFTSFGYFLDDAEHRGVVQQVAVTLAPGGHFVLDYLNAEHVRRTLQRTGQAPGGDRDVLVTRRLAPDSRFVIKEIELRDEGRRFQERVRLYSVDELMALFTDAGLRVTARFGDYDGAPAGPDMPRVILVGARA